MKKLIFTILLAAVLWTVMFSPWTAPFVNFWWMMTGSALTLSVFATLFNPGWWREVELAECLAGTWHCCCFVGRFLVGRQGVILDVRFCPSAGGLHLWDERGRVSLAAGSIAAVADRAGGRDFLARLCATHAFQTLESECGFCGGYFDLCTGACRFLQLHAGHGGSGGGGGMGGALPFLSEPLCRYYLVSCSVGCGGIYIFPDMIIIYKNKVAVMDCILSPIQSYTEPISVYD